MTAASEATAHVGWDEGVNYQGAWAGYMFFLALSSATNAAGLVVFARSAKFRSMRMTKGMIFLNAQDFCFSASCLLQCALAMSGGEIFGREVGCAYQAIHHTFLTMATSHTLAIMAYMNHQNLVNRTVFTYGEVARMHAATWLLDAIITVLVCVYPGRVVIQSSGTFCMPEVSEPLNFFLVFGLGVGSAAAFLIHRFWLIYAHIREHATRMAELGGGGNKVHAASTERALKQSRMMARRIGVLLVTFLVCSSVFLATAFYEMVSGNLAPSALMIVAVFFIHGNSFANPVLYFWMSKSARDLALKTLGLGHCSVYFTRQAAGSKGGRKGGRTTTTTLSATDGDSIGDVEMGSVGTPGKLSRASSPGSKRAGPRRADQTPSPEPLTPNCIDSTPPALVPGRQQRPSSAPASPRSPGADGAGRPAPREFVIERGDAAHA